MYVMSGLVLVLSAPGGVDAKGALRDSFPVGNLAAIGLSGGLYGLNLAYVSASAVEVSPGSASMPDGAAFYTAAASAPITVNINASGAGGLDTGTKAAATWYYVWFIYNKTSGASSAIFSLSATSPTMPAGYTLKRRLGSVVLETPTPNIKEFYQAGSGPDKVFQWKTMPLTISMNPSGTVQMASLGTGASPQSKQVKIRTRYGTVINPALGFKAEYFTSATDEPFGVVNYLPSPGTTDPPDVDGLCKNGEIGYRITNANGFVYIVSWTETL